MIQVPVWVGVVGSVCVFGIAGVTAVAAPVRWPLPVALLWVVAWVSVGLVSALLLLGLTLGLEMPW